MRRRALAVAIALLLVTAGCLGSTGTSTDSTTTAPADDESTPATTTTPAPFVQSAPVDAERVAQAHADRLRDAESFTMVVTVDSETRGGNATGNASGSMGLDLSTPMRMAVDLERGRVRGSTDAGIMRMSAYVSFDAGKTYRRVGGGNGSQPTYVVMNVSEQSLTAASEDDLLASVEKRTQRRLARANFTVAGVEEYRGTRVTQLVARGVSNHTLPETNHTSVENATTVVLVGPDGLVHRIEEHRTVSVFGATTSYTAVVEYRELGETTVEKPEWLDEAKNRSESRANYSSSTGS